MKYSEHKKAAQKYMSGGGFWRPEQGENKVRVLSEFEAYGNHWDNEAKKGGICIGKDEGCKFCESGNDSQARFLMWIIDRTDGKVKIAQVGYSVIKQLGALQEHADWGFGTHPDYDITITRKGQGLETEYFVQPTPNREPLTTEEQSQADKEIKPLCEIVSKMKEKAGGSPDVIVVDEPTKELEIPVINEDEETINPDDIPF